MIELHDPLTPPDQPLGRQVWKGLPQGAKPDQVGALAERRIDDEALPMIGRRSYIDRPDSAKPAGRVIVLIKEPHGRLAGRIGDGLRRQPGAEDEDVGARQWSVLVAEHAEHNIFA